VKSICLYLTYVRNLSNSRVLWSCIYLLIMDSVHLCGLCVRNPSSNPMPWRCIYTLIRESDRLLVFFVRNLSRSLLPRKCTYTIIHCSGSLYVTYVRIHWWCLVHWMFEASNCTKNLQSCAGMSKFLQCMLNVTSLLGNSKLYILNPYFFRQCAKIIMLPGCD
jgi:hypothetical protein